MHTICDNIKAKSRWWKRKQEGWCVLSPIAGTGSQDKYITITQGYKGRREHTQSSYPKVHVVDVYYMYRLAATRSLNRRMMLVRRGTRE